MRHEDKPSLDELIHFGKLGMKWGQHKAKETAFRNKLTALGKNKSLEGTSDAKRFKYRNQSLGMRYGKTAGSMMTQSIIGAVLTRKMPTNPAQVAIHVAKIAALSASKVATQDALAKSASKRYTDAGKRLPGTKPSIFTKEDLIEMGSGAAIKAAKIGTFVLGKKAIQVKAQRAKNEAAFNRWGGNILSQKVDNVVWQSSDLKTALIDNR
jgi:hypothetical protein